MSKESFLPSLPVDDKAADDFHVVRPPVPLPRSRSPPSNEVNPPEKPKRNTTVSARLVPKKLLGDDPFSGKTGLDFHDDTIDTDAGPEEALNINLIHQHPPTDPVEMYNDELNDSVATVDLFNDRTVEISPVERATVLTEGYGTPLTNNLRRDRL